MPCLNEEETLGPCVAKALQGLAAIGVEGEVIVADNGSTDRSAEIALACGARVVHEPRKGYGAALSAGIRAAKGEIVVMADADDSYDWSLLGDFVRKIDEGYDLVMGNRFKGGIHPGAMPRLHRYLGNPVLSAVTRHLYGIPIGDFHCGMRAFRRSVFESMNVRSPGMEFATEMVVNASQRGLRIAEIPTPLYPDKRSGPPHLRSFRDGWRHLRFIVTYAPDVLYMIPGALMFLLGLLGMLLLGGGPVSVGGIRFGIHYLALASMLTLTGANVLGFGVLAKSIAAWRYALARNPATNWLIGAFSLERGLAVGIILAAAGILVDVGILWEWLERGRGSMEDTVHTAFVATTVFVLGVNTAFGAFLLNMVLNERPGNDDEEAQAATDRTAGQ